MPISDRTRRNAYWPVFVVAGATALLILWLGLPRIVARFQGPEEAVPAASPEREPELAEGEALMPKGLPPMKLKRVEKRKYRRDKRSVVGAVPAP